MECNYCKKTFSSKYTLKKHQNTTKYCLKLQNREVENYKCNGCSNLFTTKGSLSVHQNKCSKLELIKYKKEIKNLKVKLKHQSVENKKLLKQQKEEFQSHIKDLTDRLENLATKAIEKPTTMNKNNYTNNTILNLTPFDMSDKSIKDKIQEKYDLEYFMKGQRGVAEFTKENLLMDDKGKLMYICCDPSRSIFKYKDELGEVRKDVKANRLSKTITPNILNKAHSLVLEEVKNNDKEDENEKNKRNMEHYDMFFKIKEFESNPEKLGTELSKIVT